MAKFEKMKTCFTAAALVLGTMSPLASATAMAQQQSKQTVTINAKSMNVKDFLAEVKKQTGLNFIYSTDLAAKLPHISVSATNRPLRSLLDEVMKKVNCEYDIEGNIVTITRKIAGNRVRNISGTVVDESGAPLIGVSICIDDSKVCTVTDSEGFYTLKVPTSACKLKFSYLGMSTAETRLSNGLTPLRRNIQMSTNYELSEVVVTGYQEISKPKMTGSVTTITADKLADRYTTNIMNNLEGRVAGLSTYNGKMTIRGTASLYAETTPLLVVDGVPVEGSIDDLNPYDIESVNVLKDAAANAIYGARASNGVIVVTTKNAKKAGKIDIDFSANLTVYENQNVDYADNFYMTPEQQVNTESDYWNYYYFNNDGEVDDPIGDTETLIRRGTSMVTPIQYAYYQKAIGEISDEQLQSTLASLKKNNYAKDYADAVYKQRMMRQYNLSLRGRSDKFSNNLTLNYKYDNSGLINHFGNQFNVQYKGSYEVAKWLTASFTVNGIYSKKKEAGYDETSLYANIWKQPAYMPFYNADGSVRGQHYFYDGNDYMTFESPFEDLSTNPVTECYSNTQVTRRQYMRYHGDLLFKIIDGLTANAQFVYESNHKTVEWNAAQSSHAARLLRNAYYYTDDEGNVKNYLPTTGGFLRTTNTDGRYWTARGQVNYTKTFGKHDIMAIAGLEFRETKKTGSRALMLGYDDQLQTSSTNTINLGDLSTMYYSPLFMYETGFYAQQFAYDPYIKSGMGVETETHHKYASGYFNVTYMYDERYNVFGSFRKDYADVYGLNAKFRGTPLWSVGAGWLIHNEPFMKDIKCINYLKLRASYGVTGNIYQGATSYMTATSGDLNEYTNLPYGKIESPANPYLKWEQSRTTNIGVDFSLLDNRLRGSFDFYNKEAKDVFSNKSLDPSTGFTSMFVNAASMRNRGIELQLTYDWLRAANRKDWAWTTNFTLSHNSNIVTDVENPATSAYELIDVPYTKGKPASALWSYRFAGISDEEGEKGMLLWHTENDGTSTSVAGDDPSILEYSGQTEPKVIMGMDNTVKWNGFSLSVLMAYYGGHKMRALAQEETTNDAWGAAISSYFVNAWTPENPTNTPGIGRYASSALGSEAAYSNLAVHDASFLKIRNIVFGYEFPQQWIKRMGINRLTLRFQIDNPKYLWVANKVHVDPETLGLRNPSSFIFGLNVNF